MNVVAVGVVDPVDIGLSLELRVAIGKILNSVLATEYALYIATRGAHWNVVGLSFFELHKFFQQQYEQLDNIIDDVAERTRAIGMYAVSSLHDYTALAYNGRIEQVANATSAQLIQGLLIAHETLIRYLRVDLGAVAELGDDGTLDFLTGLMEQHEKMAWMLRAAVTT